MSKSELDPPVTKKSSKAKLWAELKCANDECEQIMQKLHDLSRQNERLVALNASHELRLSIISATMRGMPPTDR